MACSKCEQWLEITEFSSPYVIRTCPACGRQVKLRQAGEGGRGIKVEKGDQFVFPDGWLKISANPLKGGATFSRYGLEWFAKLVFLADLPGKRDQFEEEIEATDRYATDVIKRSPLLKGLDIEKLEDASAIYRILNDNQSTAEWWAYLLGSFNSIAESSIRDQDAKSAAWAIACAERCRAMVVFKENFEDVVFMGHSAKRVVDAIKIWDANRMNDNEAFWQQFFKDNTFLLSLMFSTTVLFIGDKAYVGGTNVDGQDAKFIDYLFSRESSNNALLVEIKTPQTKLLAARYRKGVYAASHELSGAVVQALARISHTFI